ncbi:MAG: flagellar basal body-associated protein FliL [Gammaproteobacteria bacterium]
MAEEDLELDESSGGKKGGSNLKLIIILSLVGLLVVGGAVAATLFFTGALSGGDKSAEEGEAKEASAPKPAQYLPLDPPFVVNFEDQQQIRFLQIAVEVMARDPAVIEAVQTHKPAIRNNLVILFSSQDAATVGTREGKEQLRAQTLEEINQIIRKETGGKEGIEAVYFTSFVMQ